MTDAAASRARTVAVLGLGSAIALLERDVPERSPLRDLIATAALRHATGRPDIVIERRVSGRPRLRTPYPELAVSMAGRADFLLVGFSPDAHVGVDIEPEVSVPMGDVERLARDHFAPAEADAVRSAGPGPQARDIFLRLWVAKEAALKLTGRGVFDGLREPDFSAALDRLILDDAAIDVPPTCILPRFRVSTRHVLDARAGRVYCALAVGTA